MSDAISILRTLDLPGGSVVPFTSLRGERVRVLYGRVWLTEQGNPHDAFLASGQEVGLSSRGLAVIEALSPARIQLVEEVRNPWRVAPTIAALVRAVVRRISRAAPRGLRIARGAV